jgi:hypothetical protein
MARMDISDKPSTSAIFFKNPEEFIKADTLRYELEVQWIVWPDL